MEPMNRLTSSILFATIVMVTLGSAPVAGDVGA